MDKIKGNIYKGLGKFFEYFLGIIIYILNIIVVLIDSIKKLLGLFSILFIFMLLNPFLWGLILFNPFFITALFILFIVPLLGKGLISYLKYIQYIVTEFFYDRADFYLLGKGNKYSFGEYGARYTREKEEQARRESERRAREQQKMWEEMFRNFYNQQQQHRNTYGGNYQGQYNRRGYQENQGRGFYNPTNDFIKKYEESCKILGLEPTTDKYEIKLAYRKMAKKYHPDINKAPDATEKFQKINDANEFLSEANIERYERLKKQVN